MPYNIRHKRKYLRKILQLFRENGTRNFSFFIISKNLIICLDPQYLVKQFKKIVEQDAEIFESCKSIVFPDNCSGNALAATPTENEHVEETNVQMETAVENNAGVGTEASKETPFVDLTSGISFMLCYYSLLRFG